MYKLRKAAQKKLDPLDKKPAAVQHGSMLDQFDNDDEVFEQTVLKPHLEQEPVVAPAPPAQSATLRRFSSRFPEIGRAHV